ncbi:hypothetical protein [Streptomyces sp. KL116D]|uniref:hypothetical protein n=1 Tax=Streptomyces sp. KL116D TaxID=3045152 RepID=UPI003557A923
MTIKMTNLGLTWTDADGKNHASAVSYDKKSADDRKRDLETAGCTDIEIHTLTFGQVLTPRT